MSFKFHKICEEHKILNCPDPKCNPGNVANKIMKEIEEKHKKLDLKKVKNDTPSST